MLVGNQNLVISRVREEGEIAAPQHRFFAHGHADKALFHRRRNKLCRNDRCRRQTGLCQPL